MTNWSNVRRGLNASAVGVRRSAWSSCDIAPGATSSTCVPGPRTDAAHERRSRPKRSLTQWRWRSGASTNSVSSMRRPGTSGSSQVRQVVSGTELRSSALICCQAWETSGSDTGVGSRSSSEEDVESEPGGASERLGKAEYNARRRRPDRAGDRRAQIAGNAGSPAAGRLAHDVERPARGWRSTPSAGPEIGRAPGPDSPAHSSRKGLSTGCARPCAWGSARGSETPALYSLALRAPAAPLLRPRYPHETHLPAEEAQARTDARVSHPHAYPCRAPRSQAAS